MEKIKAVIAEHQLWVNSNYGLKTRHWEENGAAEMVWAAKKMRTNQQKKPF